MDPDHLYLWLMAFLRASGLLALSPVFSGRNIPVMVRLAIAAFLGWAGGNLSNGTATPPAEVIGLILASAHELLIGLLMGMGIRIIFFALETAGQIISTETGLVMSAQIDPISQNNNTTVTSALSLLGMTLFFISGAHHAMFAAFTRSFALVPPGAMEFRRGAGEAFVAATGNIFLIAVQMAAPLMAINFVITLSFALLGKAAPGINAFSESAPVRILAGMSLLGLSLGLSAQLVLSHLRAVPELMLRLIP